MTAITGFCDDSHRWNLGFERSTCPFGSGLNFRNNRNCDSCRVQAGTLIEDWLSGSVSDIAVYQRLCPPPALAQKRPGTPVPGPQFQTNYFCTKLVLIVFASVWICMIDCPPFTITKYVWATFPVLPLKVAVPVQFELTL